MERGVRGVRGVRLGVDVGEVRVGVAACDPDGILAYPVETVPRSRTGAAADTRENALDTSILRIRELVGEYAAVEVIIGDPISLSARRGAAAVAADAYAEQLARVISPVPVRRMDERLTTTHAQRMLSGQGVRGRRQRDVVDQAAAVLILQTWLDMNRSRA